MLARLSTCSATVTLTGPPSICGGDNIALGSSPAGKAASGADAAAVAEAARLKARSAASPKGTNRQPCVVALVDFVADETITDFSASCDGSPIPATSRSLLRASATQ